jgi:hypothetical protein
MEDPSITSRILVLAALEPLQLEAVTRRIEGTCRGRPWSCSLQQRVVITCAALRTNLTMRELAAVFAISKSTVHRIVACYTRRLAEIAMPTLRDRRESWVVDGTLVPTRDHRYAAKSKNYRWSCNAQVLIRRRDLYFIAAVAAGPGNRNDPIHYRGSCIEQLCKEHRRVLADGGYRLRARDSDVPWQANPS